MGEYNLAIQHLWQQWKDGGAEHRTHTEEDQSYAKASLGAKADENQETNKILGVEWDVERDNFLFNLCTIATALEGLAPTKRSVVSVTAKFFDPLGIVSPVTVLFKMFTQDLCQAVVEWDEALKGDLLKHWTYLLTMMKDPRTIMIPWCVFSQPTSSIESAKRVGFCDASTKAYAAVVYLRIESDLLPVKVEFLAAKTRVTPIGGLTIPHLKLLSVLLLSKLIDNVNSALQSQMCFNNPMCFSDSQVTLYWIQGTHMSRSSLWRTEQTPSEILSLHNTGNTALARRTQQIFRPEAWASPN